MAAGLLLTLIFVSKVSFRFIPGFPFSWSSIIYQYGLHPYLNLAFQLPLTVLLLRDLYKTKVTNEQILTHRIFIASLSAILLMLSIFQFASFEMPPPWIDFFGASLSAILLILIYSRWIPKVLPLEKFIKALRTLSIALTLISILYWAIGTEIGYRGGRFIGVFKHIPHLVSTATLAFILTIPLLFQTQKRIWITILLWTIQTVTFFTLLLTGTRSAAGASLIALILGFFLFDRTSKAKVILKLGFTLTLLMVGIFFGTDIGKYTESLARGEVALGDRAGQDGLASRWEEVLRGSEFFSQSPIIGKGLLFKYQSGSGELNVGDYNSFKDPHNYFISAGVIGGWPLILAMSVLIFLVILNIWRNLKSNDSNIQIIALYVLVHLPILMIYHQHFSIGGIADRLYWLMFGYLALKRPALKKIHSPADK